MNPFVEQRLKEIEEKGYEIDIAQLWGNGFTIWKKVTLPILLARLLYGFPMAIAVCFCIPFLFGMNYDEFFSIFQHIETASIQLSMITKTMDYQLRVFLLTFISIFVTAPLMPGLITMCHDADIHDKINFGVAFKYFAPRYYGKVLLATIIITAGTSAPALFFNLVPFFGPFINLGWLALFMVLISLAMPLIIFADASPLEAFKVSISIVSKNYWMVLVFWILGIIFACVGFILCCIGILFTISYFYITYYLLYKQIIGFEKKETDDELLASPSSIY